MTKKTPQESLATVASAGDFSGAEGTTPLHFVAPDWLVYSAGTSICFWRFQETTDDDPLEISSSKPTPKQHPVGTKLYLNPTVKTDSGTPHVISGIARLAANPIKKTVAFAERGAVPSIFLSSFETMETCTVLEGLCNLDVADLAFSR
uniref:Uncharacterized protein n=1 Tax=Chromera velia CCMP2878 TaxID=1169474 RepID=A0A0G4I5E8_9ALVE|eukprot:Cvel_11158.t1-p1 / transcript=Cvel_11158.t1 / gene=Cvel_11158 / organism=Chromera_velia_CCMP2878 / gene_product=hypothetical protein / transcript_product=hypothetical protein / location=Cvel_scaffold692:40053-40493(+) / protein_length=147 / sequence_SO=supercontig / SO=protein_coding / is_pseudo=false